MAQVSQGGAFPVQWDDPADAERTWLSDPMHLPDVVTPLGFELNMAPFLLGFGIAMTEQGIPTEFAARLFNGYVYVSAHQEPPSGGPPSPDEMLQRIAPAGDRWRNALIPELEEHIHHFKHTDFDSQPDDALLSELISLKELRLRLGHIHHLAVMPWMMSMNILIDTYKELTGREDEVAAVRLVQGYGSKSVEAGNEMWRLSRLASSIPSVRSRLLEVTPQSATRILDDIRQDKSAKQFVDSFAAYLDEYGWRSDLFEFSTPAWAEIPTIPLCQLRAYLEMEGYDPEVEHRRLAQERDDAVRETLQDLSPEVRERFEAILKVAADLASLQEDHNFYIDQQLATLPRRLALAAGRRMAEKGSIESADDIFYLHADELSAALSGESGFGSIVESRKVQLEEWSRLTPPPFLGPPPPDEPDPVERFWGGRPKVRADQPNVLMGNGGSAGIARGPARVIMNLNEANRLQKGDVLVARTTMPPWTPLFPVSNAIVVETGGILSHAAVTAREYGIPAVLNVAGATRMIRDGQLLEVDGVQGTVRILS